MSEEAMKVLQEQIANLEKKNTELVGEVRDKAKALKKFDDLDLDGLKNAAAELEQAKLDKKKEVGEFQSLYEAELTKTSELSGQLTALSENNADLSKKLEVNKHLPNVFPELRDIAVNQLVGGLAVADDGAIVSPDGKTAKDFVASWAESPVGKRMIQAEVNTGGNASGGNSGGKNTELGYFKKGSSTWNLTKQGEIRKRDPELAKRLAKQAEGS